MPDQRAPIAFEPLCRSLGVSDFSDGNSRFRVDNRAADFEPIERRVSVLLTAESDRCGAFIRSVPFCRFRVRALYHTREVDAPLYGPGGIVLEFTRDPLPGKGGWVTVCVRDDLDCCYDNTLDEPDRHNDNACNEPYRHFDSTRDKNDGPDRNHDSTRDKNDGPDHNHDSTRDKNDGPDHNHDSTRDKNDGPVYSTPEATAISSWMRWCVRNEKSAPGHQNEAFLEEFDLPLDNTFNYNVKQVKRARN
jgi:hypothetical protein